ncbi:DMT family transporter [Bdellovibrio bacteriovorus]
MRHHFLPLGLLLIAMLSIQYGASIAKQFFPLAGAAGTTALRVSFSAIMLFIAGRAWKHKISKDNVFILLAYGVSLGLMNLTFYFALERIPLGIAVAIEFIGPLSVAVLASKKPVDLLWVALAASGIYLILPTSEYSGNLDPIGILYVLCAALFWALYIVFAKSAGKHGSSLQVSAWGMVFAALSVLPFGIVMEGDKISNPSLWPMGIAIALLSSAIPYSLEMKAMRNIPAKTFGILMSLEPVVATVIGILFLQETLEPMQWGAILCIVVASAGTSLSS